MVSRRQTWSQVRVKPAPKSTEGKTLGRNGVPEQDWKKYGLLQPMPEVALLLRYCRLMSRVDLVTWLIYIIRVVLNVGVLSSFCLFSFLSPGNTLKLCRNNKENLWYDTVGKNETSSSLKIRKSDDVKKEGNTGKKRIISNDNNGPWSQNNITSVRPAALHFICSWDCHT